MELLLLPGKVIVSGRAVYNYQNICFYYERNMPPTITPDHVPPDTTAHPGDADPA
jgi:hypothetical protein